MQSRRRRRRSFLSVLPGLLAGKASYSFFFYFFFFTRSGKDFGHMLALGTTAIIKVSPLCPPVTQWLLRSLPSSFPYSPSPSSFLFLLSLLPSLPYLAWLCIIYCDCIERAASALKPVETSSERKQEGRKRVRASVSPHCLVAGVFLFPVLVFSFLFAYFWWTGHRSGRKDCACRWRGKEESWCRTPTFRNARSGLRMVSPATPSFAWFLHLCLQTLSPPLSPAATPFARSDLTPGAGSVAHWFEWRLYRHGANGRRSTGKIISLHEMIHLSKGCTLMTM